MAIDLFRLQHGIEIENDVSGVTGDILVGSGLPGGDGGIQDAAPIGSLYLRTDVETNNLQLYYKHTTANNSSADWKQSADKDYVDAVASGISWREPVAALDSTLYANSAAFPTTGVIDGVTLSPGDRVLFTNVTDPTAENIWIWDGSAWTEDTNQESAGDAVLVNGGTAAGQQWTYDGTNWVQFGSDQTAELGYLRTFVGKTGPGSELPTYSSTDVITQGSSLETAIGDLDNAMGNGDITNTTGNYSLSSDMTWSATPGTLEITDALNSLNNAVGDRTYTNDNVVTDGETVAQSIDALDTAVGNINAQNAVFTGTNVNASAGATVDTIPLADATEAKWIIQIRENGTPANRRAYEIHALNDGATLIDYTNYAVLKLGSAIAGLSVSADISGTDMRLRVTATNNIDYVVRRMGYTAF